MDAIDRAIEITGSQDALARRLGVSSAAISQWRTAGRVPVERVIALAEVVGCTPYSIRPDVYPRADWTL